MRPAALCALLVAVFAPEALAAGTKAEKQVCATAYEKVQTARAAGKLYEAREQAIACSQDVCGAAKKDCTDWLAEIESSTPTVLFEARDLANNDTTDVKVSVDGKVFQERLDGKSKRIDPGEHAIHYELAGAPPIDQKVIFRQGEMDRKISVSWAPHEAAETAPAPSKLRSILPYAFGGLGVVGLGMFATFGVIGKNGFSDLETSCKPNCTADQIAPVHTKLLIADVSLAVGVVSLGIATVLFVTAPKQAAPKSAWRLDAAPTPHGAFASLGRSF